ncbi:MAG TPA: class I SAM-dependent methyltransferase [Candidatus Limnocylindria bacterium]|nr:class I SAM-dependent methyltransferase [Candidatus Limnocylindria bacterium]
MATASSSPTSPTSQAFSGAELGGVLHADAYVLSRLQPPLSDPHCLALRDILAVVRPFAGDVRGRLFDYGCGGAPYRSLFTGLTEYVRADVTPGPNVDRLLPTNGLTDEPPGHYDAVLSTQVLEHVLDPAAYLRECARILRPGGRLLVTTHGLFEEHGCPYDFHRWTARGLELAVTAAGLEVESCSKLTGGVRGSVQQLHYLTAALFAPERPGWHKVLGVLRRLHKFGAVAPLNWFAGRFPMHAVVPADHWTSIYVGVAVRARKPGATAVAR